MSTAATETAIGKGGIALAAKVSQMKEFGWVTAEEDGKWYARKDGQPDIGPAASLRALVSQVEIKQGVFEQDKGNGKTHKVGSSKLEGGEYEPKDTRLPGMEEPELDELNSLADECIQYKSDKEAANAAFKDQCDVMRERMRALDRKRYTRAGFTLTIEDSEKLVIKKAEGGKPKNPSTKKGKKADV